ncbi:MULTISPECIES: MFS transporter [Achromobacter]|uniref:NTP/NDP exchange transporter n=1 Tax=Achromobacter TaxID=222 RepID=UPI00244B31F0|nr:MULTISPECIES: MFS transporter [Achromobacter]MDH1300809.1 MFS transporter [Achromobacter sp. GD03932]WLW60459.1 MFS transporter [Achromobacter aegrifaciens]
MASAPGSLQARAAQALGILQEELAPAACGFAFFFFLFCGYFMLRPIRETMGIQAGVDQLQWLFTATFVAMLAVVPLFGWLSARVPRAMLVTWVYAAFALSMAGFAALLHLRPGSVWAARSFYVWLSVFNLFVVSIAWSLMADVFRMDSAKRLFALIAAGASAGGLAGPLLGGLLAGVLGPAGLLLLSALLLTATLPLKRWLLRWRAAHREDAAADDMRRPLEGSILAGLSRIFQSPFLLGISLLVILLATLNTFLYMEQARLVADAFTDTAQRIRVFSALDFSVQALSLLSQLFITGRVATRLGLRFLLTAVPLTMTAAFLALAAFPVFGVLAAAMIVRRVGEYALIRPGREMLFTAVSPEDKYKTKNVIDTVVYRAGDAASGWVKAGVDMLGYGAALIAVLGALCALAAAAVGHGLGRTADRRIADKS